MTGENNNMEEPIELPQKILDMVGQEFVGEGHIFSKRKKLPPTKFKCLKVKPVEGVLTNVETGESRFAVKVLLKNESMKRAQWSIALPV
jgi:hypothetical protein